jgi:hypothetical protein
MPRRLSLILILLAALTSGALTTHRLAQQVSGPRSRTLSGPPQGALRQLSNDDFGRLIQKLSEPGGYFDTDNLISNEASYLHVLGKLRRMAVQQGAYIGVGPDQNFSYIAQIRPQIVYLIDIRRDNLLQHLLFKALFAGAHNRVEYLALLFGKPAPADWQSWDAKSLEQLVELIDKTPSRRDRFEATKTSIRAYVKGLGLNLSDGDFASIARIHDAFFEAGLDLRFTSKNRPPRAYYPTYRDLLLEKDLTGKQASFVGSEADFQFLKSLQAANLVIPVVGNLAGELALAAIARDATERGLRVSALYTSNVEFYLMREGGFDGFVENVKRLPYGEQSVIIRSYFSGGFGYPHPQSVAGYYSTQLLQTIASLVKEYTSGGYDSYSDLVTKHSLDLR